MQKSLIELPEMRLVGITARTNNKTEADKMKGKIWPCVQRYFHQQLFDQIQNRKKPGITICAYTEYESDYTGDYTYFIGEEVTSHTDIPEGFDKLLIPAQNYAKFTTGPDAMPDVLIKAWNQIWTMTPKDFGGKRNYHTDFELYDERAQDHQKVVLDIFIGLCSDH